MCVYVCLCILEFMCKCVCCRTVNMLFKNLIVFRGAETSNSVKRICDADKEGFSEGRERCLWKSSKTDECWRRERKRGENYE